MVKIRATTQSSGSGSTDNQHPSTSPRRRWKTGRATNSSSGGSTGKSTLSAMLFRPCRVAVSSQKTRFMEDGFDLDLAYVTKRIIVHGVPNASADPMYDDPRTEVRRLLDKYHLNHYKVYNFASELAQMSPAPEQAKLDGRTERYPFTDDDCPPLESVVDFCENAKAWLDTDAENVVSLHCKAGKGRAGIMAACLMVRMGETAEEAVAKYDLTQGSDVRGRTAVSQRAWVFLYERLIREVWGLRDTIGTISGQNPSLRAPPRLATSLREVSLELQSSPRRRKWRPVLYNPSCAVYQQTPVGKAMVHRAKMPLMQTGGKGGAASFFSASMPRSVVVEGTFQVVVSAATGMFGLGKNVLDVWCNTTFLGEDGGQEAFSFTANDLPPGALANRLLAADVRVVLTHTHPDGASPIHRRVKSTFDTTSLGANGGDGEATIISNPTHDGGFIILNADGEEVVTPETEEEGINSNDDVAEGEGNTDEEGSNFQRRVSRSSDRAPVAGTPNPSPDSLQIAVIDDDTRDVEEARAWELRLAAMAGPKISLDARSLSTPVFGNRRPSPLRSCPRAAVSRTDSFFGESTEDAVGATGLPRWASSKIWGDRGPPLSIESHTPTMGAMAKRPPRGAVPPSVIAIKNEDSAPMGRHCQTPPPGMPTSLVDTATASGASSFQQLRQDGSVSRHRGGESSNVGLSGREERRPWAALTIANPSPRRALPRHSERVKAGEETPDAESSMFCWSGSKGKDYSDNPTSYSPESATKDGAAVRRMLQSAAERSFEDLLSSSRHTPGSTFGGSDMDQSDAGASGSISDSDGERASHVARALAGWVDSGMGPMPTIDLSHKIPAIGDRRPIVRRGDGTMDSSSKYIETEDMTSIPPLNQRGWPPPKPVVAGEMEIHDALLLGEEQEKKQQRGVRKWASAGASWGEEAKLALARKRLQWEKSRRGSSEGSESLRMYAAMVAKREAEILAIETDVKQAVRLLEERIARREKAEAALNKWRRELPPKAYEDVMSCLAGNKTFAAK